MENLQAQPDRNGWDAVRIDHHPTRSQLPHRKRGRWISSGVFVVALVAAHGSIAYFGWGWLRSQLSTAPTLASMPPAARLHAQELPLQPTQRIDVSTTRLRASELTWTDPNRVDPGTSAYDGQMRWSRRDGLTTVSVKRDEWKCAGGFYFTTTRAADGSTIVSLVEHRGKPVPCNE